MVGSGQSSRAATGDVTDRSNFQRLVVVLAPLVVVDRSGRRTAGGGVVAVGIRNTRLLGKGVTEGVSARMVSVRIPVQAPAGPVENPIEGLTRSRVGVEHQKSGEAIRISGAQCGRADNQVPVARQDAHMVAVLVERMLPTALSDGANQDLLAWMHMRIAVIGLERITAPKRGRP